MAMRNVTITLDEETARWARVEAAKRDTSLSRFVGEVLRARRVQEDDYQAAMKSNLARGPYIEKAPGTRYPTREELYDRPVFRRYERPRVQEGPEGEAETAAG